MTGARHIGLIGLLVAGMVAAGRAQSPAVLLEKGIHQEETVGDLDAAMAIYRRIIEDGKANRKSVAEAKYRLGVCYLKRKEHKLAAETIADLLATFPDQEELVAKGRKALAAAKSRMGGRELAKTVEEAVTVISTCAETDPRVAKALASLEGLSDEGTTEALAGYLDSDKATVRRSAVYILWKGPMADIGPAVDALGKLLTHEEDLTRGMAAIALGGRKTAAAYEAICEMALKDASGYARRCAAYALGLMGRPEARQVLEKALKDEDSFVRNNAEAALTMLAKAAGGVEAAATPRVIRTVPAAYADDVPADLPRLSVTFDRRMKDRCWSWVQRFPDKYPQTTGQPSYDAEATTCSLPVKLQPAKVYWMEINSPPYTSFQDESGHRAEMHIMVFATKSADGKATPIPQDLLDHAKAVNDSAGKPAPAVVATSPAALADDVPAATDRITVTFDQPMMDESWSWVKVSDESYPETPGKPSYDGERKICSLPVKLQPGKVYWVQVNSAEHTFFQSPAGKPAKPYVILFATRSADGKPTLIPTGVAIKARAINAAGPARSVTSRKVDRALSSLPAEQDLSAPEGAWAAWQRAQVRKDADAVVALSWVRLDPAETARFWESGEPEDMRVYLQAIQDSKLLEVLTWGDDLAGAIGLLPFPAGKGRDPYSLRFLGRIGGQWKSLGEDRCASQEAAVAAFGRKKELIGAQLAKLAEGMPSGADQRASESLSVEGWRLWGQRKFAEAEAKFQQAVEADPRNANAWNGLGWAQQNQGKTLNAAHSFEKCLAIEPKHPAALNGLGWVARMQGKTDEAIGYWKKAVDALPSATAALSGLAMTCTELGRYDEAIRYCEMWLKAEPNSAEAKEALDKARKARGKAGDPTVP